MTDTNGYCAIWRKVLAHKHPCELSPPEREAFDRHLLFCSACSSIVAEEQELIQLVYNALSPKKPLPSWSELVRAYADTHALSLSQRRIQTILSISRKRFDIEEVQSTLILKEDVSQFIDIWPPLLTGVM